MNKILEVKELNKYFGGLAAVDHLTFDVCESEILGIIGPNGAGKSTVLNLICGYYPPTSGKITFDNKVISNLRAHQIARLGIGRNFQATVLFMKMSVIDNVFAAYHMKYRTNVWQSLFMLSSGVKEEESFKRKAGEIIERMGLNHFKNEITGNLPYGYQRILGVCIALATDPKLLLLDEPLTGMNQNEIMAMIKLIKDIRDSGVTIVMIEHNMQAVMSLCERIVVLNFGKKIAEGLPEDIRQNENVIEAYFGQK